MEYNIQAIIYVAYYHLILVLKYICTESRACRARVFENFPRRLRSILYNWLNRYARLFYWKSFDFACPTRPIHNILKLNKKIRAAAATLIVQ